MHQAVNLPILYFGTPVVLISTLNQDRSVNVAPSSSIWWLADSCMIGLDGSSKTTENLKRTGECVLNLPSADIVSSVNRIANTTGSKSVPLHKQHLGYKYVKDKLKAAGLSTDASVNVKVPRIAECQVQLEALLVKSHRISEDNRSAIIPMFAFELKIVQSHIEQEILMGEQRQYVDPDKWHPLIMCFRKFYTTHREIHPSKLSEPSVEKYRSPELSGLKGTLTAAIFRLLYKKYF